jgi:polynucleotide 5'-hydroxyl-kinase GRC3/NOL9
MRFVGSLSPTGHLLQTVVATKGLVEKALRQGARTVLVDTTGLVGQSVGFQLKRSKIELLQPRHIVALQRGEELEDLLSVTRGRPGLTVHRLAVFRQVRTRSPAERYLYRTSRFAQYFRLATRVQLETKNLFILSPPTGRWKLGVESLPPVISLGSIPAQSNVGCLLGLNNAANDTLALGLLERITHHGQKIEILTPLRNCHRVRIVQMADIRLAKTGEDLRRAESPVDKA